MTVLFQSLGFSSLTDKQAVDQCVVFKRQLRSALKNCEGVSLVIVTDPETRRSEIRAVYDRENQEQVEWARLAKDLAPEVWRSLRNRRQEIQI